MKPFLHYVLSRIEDDVRRAEFMYYISDSIYYHNYNKYLDFRLRDYFAKQHEEQRNAQDIINDVIQKGGLKIE